LKLVVIIPALDEEATVATVVRGIPREIEGVDRVEVVVVDDGSSDRTAELAREAGATVVSHGENQGVGAAFATGIRVALDRGADLVVNMDGDGQFDPADIPTLIQPVQAGDAGFVTCTRFGRREFIPSMPWVKRAGNWGMARLISAIVGKRFTDVSCGFRCYSRDTALRLNLFGRFTYTQESFISLAAQNVVLREVPLRVLGVREHGKSRVANSVVRYGVRSSAIILRALRDHRPLAFFGSIGAGSLGLGVLLGGFVFAHWLRTGGTSPYRSVLLGSTALLIVGIVLGVLALLADMLGRMRRTNEALLYETKRRRVPEETDDP
jgi:glycosyltransferase involved in cell wall biosynthesis